MVLGLICALLEIYVIVLSVRIVLSWIPRLPDPVQPAARVVYMLTDPVLNPVRGLLPPIRTGAVAFDLSPILVFLGLQLLISAIC